MAKGSKSAPARQVAPGGKAPSAPAKRAPGGKGRK